MLLPVIHFSMINLKTVPKIEPCFELLAVDCGVLPSDLSLSTQTLHMRRHFPFYFVHVVGILWAN
jgi:hypothetical protein